MDPIEEKADLQVHPVEQSTEPSSSLHQIRTYQGDVASAIQRQNETLVSIQRAQAQKNSSDVASGKILSQEEIEENKSRKTAVLLMVGTLVLILIGAGGGWYAYNTYKQKTALPTTVVIPNRFLITENSEQIDAISSTRDSIILAVQNARLNNQTTGVHQIQIVRGGDTTQGTSLLKTEDFFNLLRSHAPSSLIRSFDPLFMFGVIGVAPKHSFLLIKLDSFDNAFPGMIDWEKNIADDILPLFASNEVVQNLPSQTQFSDLIIKNKDTRALKSPDGKVVLLYSFYDNNLLIITNNEETLKTLLLKLDSEKLSR